MISLSLKTPQNAVVDQLCVAAENMRHDEPADAEIDDLGATLLNGQLIPLFVRKGRDGEKEFAILDGRRRFLAYKRLIKAKAISPKSPIAIVVCTTPEEIAAATVIANDSRLAISKADVLLAIHKLSSEFKTVDEIGKVLGIEPREIRKMQRLGAVDVRLLQAFKAGKVDMALLKAVARLDPSAITPAIADDWARKAKISQLYYHHIRLGGAGEPLSAKSARLRFINLADYTAQGGRIEQDLFGEDPDKLLDPMIVDRLFVQALEPVAEVLRDAGLVVAIDADLDAEPEDGSEADGLSLAQPSWNFVSDADAAEMETTRREVINLNNTAAAVKHDAPALLAAVELYTTHALRLARLRYSPLEVVACEMSESHSGGLTLEFYVRRADLEAHMAANGNAPQSAAQAVSSYANYAHAPVAVPGETAETEGGGWLVWQHQQITTTAGRALALSLARDPEAAFDALLATLFRQCVLNTADTDFTHQLLRIKASGHRASNADGDDPLLRPILDALAPFVTAYAVAELHPIDWIGTLTDGQKAELLAQIVALQVDTKEEQVNRVRSTARTEAAHLAKVIGHDVRFHYRPDADFYAKCTKKLLGDFAEDMGVDPVPLAKLKRGDMAAKIFALAGEHDYVPPAFSFVLAVKEQGAGETQADQVAA